MFSKHTVIAHHIDMSAMGHERDTVRSRYIAVILYVLPTKYTIWLARESDCSFIIVIDVLCALSYHI